MTGISLHMQWPMTSQLNGSVSQREQLFFRCGSNSMSKTLVIFVLTNTASLCKNWLWHWFSRKIITFSTGANIKSLAIQQNVHRNK
jgi:hypothetical protein